MNLNLNGSLFLTIFAAAILVEATVNIVDNIKERETSWKYWGSLVAGILVAVVVAVNYGLDLFSALGLEGQIPVIGAVLTGVIISRGANYVADLLKVLTNFGGAG